MFLLHFYLLCEGVKPGKIRRRGLHCSPPRAVFAVVLAADVDVDQMEREQSDCRRRTSKCHTRGVAAGSGRNAADVLLKDAADGPEKQICKKGAEAQSRERILWSMRRVTP